MNRLFPVLTILALLCTHAALAQLGYDVPVAPPPSGIDAQPLPPPPQFDNRPTSLVPSQSMIASPAEGQEERSMDQALGGTGPAPSLKPLKPSAHSDAAIEDRITATVLAPTAPQAQPAVTRSAERPTQVISGSMSYPSTTAPANSRWEGPQERALDQALPGTNLVAPQGQPDVEEDEVRRLNGGLLNQ